MSSKVQAQTKAQCESDRVSASSVLSTEKKQTNLMKDSWPSKPVPFQPYSASCEYPNEVPPIVHDVVRSPGQPLEPATRTFMEPRFGHDFSQVRVHTDARAAKSASVINAQAYTVGHHTVFGRGRYTPQTCGGRYLLAHELMHVVSPSGGGILRAVASDYDEIEDRLTYGLFDWAITDQNARDVLVILSGLNATDLADTLTQMETDGLLNRLLENISDADHTTYDLLIRSIHQHRGVSETASHIENLMSYGVLDWVITDHEAHVALEALLDLRSMPDRLRDVVAAIPADQYERFYGNLSEEDRADNLRFLMELEMIRRTGMTLDEMSIEQRTHLEAEATAAGVSVGTYIRGEVSARSFGGYTATWWPSLLPAQQAAWTARFNTILARIRVEAPEEVREVIADAESAGGGIQWMPQDVEEAGPNALALNRGDTLGVGRRWLLAAESNLPDVYENIMHELGGHRTYGSTVSWDIMSGTLASLPPGERTIAGSGPRSLYGAYGYMETEIYAELRELPYRTPGSQGDVPATNVEEELRDIQRAFDPDIAEAIVRGLRRRVQLDSLITDEARSLLDQKIRVVFGITF